MAKCFLVLLLCVGMIRTAAAEGRQLFIPMLHPLQWYKGANLEETGGELPQRPAFAILKTTAKSLKIALGGSIGGRTAYVRRDRGYVTGSGQAVTFSELIHETDRAPLRFWLSEDRITEFMTKNVSDSILHSIEEYMLEDHGRPDPLPVLSVKPLSLRVRKKSVKLIKTVLRFPNPSKVRELRLEGIDAVRRVVFVIDASGSMVPEGRRVLMSILERLSGSKAHWHKHKLYGAMFYNELDDRPKLQMHPFRSLSEVSRTIRQNSREFAGGGEEQEPLLDALYVATNRLPWGVRRVGSVAGQRTILAFVSVDMNAKVRGTGPYRAPKDFGAKRLISDLRKNRVNLILVQCSPEPGSVLDAFFSQLEAAKDPAIQIIRYQHGVSLAAERALEAIVAPSSAEKLAAERAKRLAESIRSLGGIPVYPRQFKFGDLADEVESIVPWSITGRTAWVQVPVWLVHDKNLIRLVDAGEAAITSMTGSVKKRKKTSSTRRAKDKVTGTAGAMLDTKARSTEGSERSAQFPDFEIFRGVRIYGANIRKKPLRRSSLASCGKACESRRRCKAFTFIKRRRACYLKSGPGKRQPDREAISGLRP